jgi:hypothetical protein
MHPSVDHAISRWCSDILLPIAASFANFSVDPLSGDVMLGVVDATIEGSLASQ